MRISDWSSDVCSSDLLITQWRRCRESAGADTRETCEQLLAEAESTLAELLNEETASTDELIVRRDATQCELQELSQNSRVHEAYRSAQIRRASCRERVGTYE